MKAAFVSLGCDKNLSDSEHMLYSLQKAGIEITPDESDADVVVVNTCCFIQSALEESINAILDVAQYKKTGHLKKLLVAGCMSERYAAEIRRDLPEVDGIVGTSAYNDIVKAVTSVMEGEDGVDLRYDLNGALPDEAAGRINTTGGVYDYLKIAEGCDKHCSYCIIPSLRGRYRSVPFEELVEEAEDLAASNIRELILVAQETTLYGTDLYGRKRLPELLRRLSAIDGIEWIRLLYCYPESVDEALIREIRDNPKVCHYIDMPIQHISDRILRKMGRRTTGQDIREKIRSLREAVPDIAIRTSLIAGFPGETGEDHQEMVSFLQEARLDRVGVFTYSREEGTPACSMPDQIPEEQKAVWRDDLMRVQQRIVFEKNASLVGTREHVLVEGYLPDDNVYVGRTYRDAPDVDGLIFFPSDRELISGSLTEIRINGYNGYDLTGECVL